MLARLDWMGRAHDEVEKGHSDKVEGRSCYKKSWESLANLDRGKNIEVFWDVSWGPAPAQWSLGFWYLQARWILLIQQLIPWSYCR
jgi:hypothetical protein